MANSRDTNHSSSEQHEQSLKLNTSNSYMMVLNAMVKQAWDANGSMVAKDKIRKMAVPAAIGQDVDGNKITVSQYLNGGNTSDIFLGNWKNNCIAIKRINLADKELSTAQSEVSIQKYLTEVKAPNVVTYYFGNTTLKDYFFVGMECMYLGSAYDYLENNRFENWQLVSILKDCAYSLDFMHSKGLLHNGIQAPNIFLKKEMNYIAAKLGGFGSSCAENQAEQRQVSRLRSWQAPEILAQKTCESKPGDVWAFGIATWQMVVGNKKLAFSHVGLEGNGDNLLNYMMATHENKLLPIPDQTPSEIKRLIYGCMRKDPNQRLKANQLVPTLFRPEVPEVEMTDAMDDYVRHNNAKR